MDRPEFKVVLLSGGRASELYPLVEDEPLALLPVVNRPIISFQLELLERAGFGEVIVVCGTGHSSPVQWYLRHGYNGRLKIDVVMVDKNLASAEALRFVKDKLPGDFIVVSGDLVCDVNIHALVDVHRIQESACTMLLGQLPPPAEGAKRKDPEEDVEATRYFGLDPEANRVVFSAFGADLEDDVLSISKNVLRRYPDLVLRRDLLDAHMYVFSHWVLELLDEKPKFVSIRADLVPYLIKKQFRLGSRAFGSSRMRSAAQLTRLPSVTSITNLEDDGSVIDRLRGKQTEALSLSSGKVPHKADLVRVFAYTADGYCKRADTLASYAELNHDLSKPECCSYHPVEQFQKKGMYVDVSADVSQKTQIGAECVVGAGTKVGDRTSVKRSIIGKYCVVGDGVKIVNSIIMDHVEIRDRVNIMNSIVCSRAFIDTEAQLRDVRIGSHYSVAARADLKDQAFVPAAKATTGKGRELKSEASAKSLKNAK